MSTFKKAKVIMLSTKEKSDIFIGKTHSVLHYKNNIPDEEFKSYQHFHIISDDEIKEGDWFMNDMFKLFKADIQYITSPYRNECTNHKKIIATTDTSLKPSCTCTESAAIYCGSKCQISLPQPSQQFIEKYIEEYNKGNIITEIMVEFENNYDLQYYTPQGGIECCNKIDNWKLKVDSNNYITITKVKDNYSKEEVKQYAWYAVQYSSKLENKGQKVIHKKDIDDYLDLEID